jgi:hypothetical protein
LGLEWIAAQPTVYCTNGPKVSLDAPGMHYIYIYICMLKKLK